MTRVRIRHVPNWTRFARPDLDPAATRARFVWPDDSQVDLHAGSVGHKQGLERAVEADRLAGERGEPIRFAIAGNGNQAEAIRALGAGRRTLGFLPNQPNGLQASPLAAADVLLPSDRATQLDMSLPSKLRGSVDAGRPISAAGSTGGASALEVQPAGAGLVVPAGDSSSMLEALARLRTEAGTTAGLGAAGQAYAAAHLSYAACLARATAPIDGIAA